MKSHPILLTTCHGDLRNPHSSPTRRSSDLACRRCPRTTLPMSNVRGGTISPGSPDNTFGTFNIDGEVLNVPKVLSDRKSTRLNSSHRCISYAVFCLKKKKLN